MTAYSKLALAGLAILGAQTAFAINHSAYEVVNKDVHVASEALEKGQATLSLRARMEADRPDGSPFGAANTLQTHLRYGTPYFSNFAGLVEFNHVQDVHKRYHNAGLDLTPNKTTRPIIDDAAGTFLARAFISYKGFEDTNLVLGRQSIELDNGRFVSTNPFRQNPTTYDALSFTNHSVADIELFYAYLWQVNTQYANTAADLGKHQHRSHLLNATYTGFPIGTFIGYTYLLHDKNVAQNSSDTIGVRYEDQQDFMGAQLAYSAEYADQRSRHHNPNDYHAYYYGLDFKANFGSIASVEDISAMIGYEVLTGRTTLTGKQFKTVLADAHVFQGTAGQFTTVADRGLEDFNAGAQATLAGFKGQAVYHRFWTQSARTRLGHEWDFDLSTKFYHRYEASFAYAHFKGSSTQGTTSINKIWLTGMATFL